MDAIQERLNLISFLKDCSTRRIAELKSIPVGDNISLIPIGKYAIDDENHIKQIEAGTASQYEEDICLLKNEEMSLNAKKWITCQIESRKDSIAFIITNKHGTKLGHVALAGLESKNHIVEIETIYEYSKNLTQEIMASCLQQIIKWVNTTMYVDGFVAKLTDSGSRYKTVLENIGFKQSDKVMTTYNYDPAMDSRETRHAEEKENTQLEKQVVFSYKEKFEIEEDSMILTAGPSISQYESYYAHDAATSGWNTRWNKYISLLENKVKDYIGVKYALATSSCTGAMHIALMALNIGVGDEVIVPDQTWVATANAIKYVGATPVFVDVDKDHWTISPSEIERAISKNTKAIMPVHMYGHPANMKAVMEIARKYNLYVVEDAAPSIGAECNGKKTGSFGHFSAFSFQGAKMMVTGEGGILLTDNEELYLKAKKIWDQGRNANSKIPFWIDEKGLKYKMSNVQAAIGVGQINRIETLIAMKRRIFRWYCKYLSNNKCVRLNHEPENCRSIYWMSSIEVLPSSRINRDQLIEALREDNVDTRPVFPAISQYPIWDNEELKPKAISLYIGNNCMNLPSGVTLSEAKIRYICERINSHTN